MEYILSNGKTIGSNFDTINDKGINLHIATHMQQFHNKLCTHIAICK